MAGLWWHRDGKSILTAHCWLTQASLDEVGVICESKIVVLNLRWVRIGTKEPETCAVPLSKYIVNLTHSTARVKKTQKY